MDFYLLDHSRAAAPRRKERFTLSEFLSDVGVVVLGAKMRRFVVPAAFLQILLAMFFLAESSRAQTVQTLKPTPKTVAWGYYDAKATPVLRVKSGDTVEIQTLITSSPKRLEEAGVAPDQVEQALRDVTAQVTDKGPGGHILTGPIYVEDAQP